MDPDIARDLELRIIGDVEYRLRLMGIRTMDRVKNSEPCDYQFVAFAEQINHGPWHRVVRRRDDARRRRLRELENEWLFWNVTLSNREAFFRAHPDAADDLCR